MIHGRITFLIALAYIVMGLLELPTSCTRGQTPPGVYEQHQINLTGDGPQNYDSWQKQLERKRERGK